MAKAPYNRREVNKEKYLFYKKTWEPSMEMKTDKWENLCVFMLRFVTKTVMGKYDWTRMYSDPSCTFKEKDIPFFFLEGSSPVKSGT